MGGFVLTKYGKDLRLQAVELFKLGYGYKLVSSCLGINNGAVRQWHHAFNSVGPEVVLVMGESHKTYSFEVKLQAVKSVVDEGEAILDVMKKYQIVSHSSLKKWCMLYRKEGPDALRPKPKGRPKNSTSNSQTLTREQELESRVHYLEAENAYLKKLAALKAEKYSQTGKKQKL